MNDYPTLYPLGKFHLYSLYHLVDKVYLKPRTVLNVLFRIALPDSEPGKKPKSWLQSPEDFASYDVLIGCINQRITQKIGFEAGLAQIDHSIELVEEMAIRIKIVGYAGTCLKFAGEFLEIFRECAKPGTF